MRKWFIRSFRLQGNYMFKFWEKIKGIFNKSMKIVRVRSKCDLLGHITKLWAKKKKNQLWLRMMTKEKFSQKVTIVSTRENACKTQPKNRNRKIINHVLCSAPRDTDNLVIILKNNYFTAARTLSETRAHEPRQALKHVYISTAVTCS